MFFSSEHPIAVLNFYNEGDQAVSFQTKIFSWRQILGKNKFSPSKDNFIVTPSVFTIKPRTNQVVRIGILNKLLTKKEKTYRLFVKQLQKTTKNKNEKINILLKISLPIFIEPIKKHISVKLIGSLVRSKNLLAIHLINKGNTHIETFRIILSGKKNNLRDFKTYKFFNYILAGTDKNWSFSLPNNLTKFSEVQAKISTNIGEINKNFL